MEVEGKRNRTKLEVYDNFIYRKDSTTVNCFYYRCVSDTCPARGKKSRTDGTFNMSKAHNHFPDEFDLQKRLLAESCKRRAEETADSLRRIFDVESQRFPLGATQVVFEQVKSTMSKRRRLMQPTIPSALEFSAYILDNEFAHVESDDQGSPADLITDIVRADTTGENVVNEEIPDWDNGDVIEDLLLEGNETPPPWEVDRRERVTKALKEYKASQPEVSEVLQCQLCSHALADAVIFPCMHGMYCVFCVNLYKEEYNNVCPNCRGDITSVCKVYR